MKFLRHPRLPGSASQPLRIRDLLIVAGPSGAGKSSFLAALAADRLAGKVAALLPAGAPAWPQTNGRRIVRGRLQRGQGDIVDGLALHYDILRPFETAIAGYADDPALLVLRGAERVTVIELAVPGERLARQLAARPPRRRVLHPLRIALRRRLTGGASAYDPATEPERHARLVARYGDPAFLTDWSRRWEAFLRDTLGSRLRHILAVEPVAGAPGQTQYRLHPDH